MQINYIFVPILMENCTCIILKLNCTDKRTYTVHTHLLRVSKANEAPIYIYIYIGHPNENQATLKCLIRSKNN